MIKILPFIIILFYSLSFAQNTPVDAVKLFERCYGTACMDNAADMTTDDFRDNRPKAVWIYDTWKTLREIGYKRLKSSVSESKTDKDKAIVILNAAISTVGGSANQKEVYFLIRKDDRWLIDELKVTDEVLDSDKTNL